MPTRILIGEYPEDLPTSIEFLPSIQQEPMMRHDRRTVDDPNKLRPCRGKSGVEDWYSEGTNHRIENGQIVRSFPCEGFFTRVEDLEELRVLLRANPDLDLSYDHWLDELRLQETE